MPVPVLNYAVVWNPTNNQGQVQVQHSIRQVTMLQVDGAPALQALLILMSKAGVMIDPATNRIELPFRSPGA